MKRDSRGFTLVELLIVLVIVGLMTAMITPTIGRTLTNLKLKTAAKKIAAALRYARSQAITRSEAYQAVFSLKEKQVTVLPEESEEDALKAMQPPGGEDGSKQNYMQKDKAKVYALPDEVKFQKVIAGEEDITSGNAVITFRTNGGSGGGEVVLCDEGEKRFLRILVNLLTGAVTIEEKN